MSVLIAPAIVTLTIGNGENPVLRYGIAGAALVIVVGRWRSRRPATSRSAATPSTRPRGGDHARRRHQRAQHEVDVHEGDEGSELRRSTSAADPL